jgi:hypothetical protein
MQFPRRMLLLIAACLMASLYAQNSGTKQDPAEIMRTFKTIYVQSKTPLAKPQMLAGELQKSGDFDKWNFSITIEAATADVVIEIDHQPGWFYYTYSMTHQASGVVLAVGRVDAWDGKYASAKAAKEILKRIARVRNVQEDKKTSRGANTPPSVPPQL